ncbi:MAG: hypothetical protein QM493_10390 [Sulfurovum sp.]
MNKPLSIYTALSNAVDGFNLRNNTCRKHLADALGYRGVNASIQFSNALSPNNDFKYLNHAKEQSLLYAMDDIAVREYFTIRLREFGLRPISINPIKMTIIKLHDATDDAMIEGDEAFKVTKLALRDKKLTIEELVAIERENREASLKYQEIADMAKGQLVEASDG